MKKIVIIDQPLNNHGDESAHKAFIRLLTEHGFKVSTIFFGSDPKAVKAFSRGIKHSEYYFYKKNKINLLIQNFFIHYPFLFNYAHLIPNFNKFCRHLNNSDVVVMAPGGANIGVYKSWTSLSDLYLALANNKKVAIWGRSVGPFLTETKSDKLFFKKSCEILNCVGYISLRDKESQQILSSLGINYVETIDTAFAYVPDINLPADLLNLKQKKYVVFVPHDLCSWHPLFKEIDPLILDKLYLDTIKKILSKGYLVVMLPQLFERGDKGDYHYFKHLQKKTNSPHINIISEKYNSDIQQIIIRNAEAVIGARYHSIIFSINNCTPFICLSYEHKMKGTLDSLGLEKYSLDLKQIVQSNDNKLLFHLLDNIIKEKKEIQSDLQKKRDSAQKKVFNAFNKFLKYIEE